MKYGKKMKRVCGLFILFALSLAISACGKNESAGEEKADSTIENAIVAETEENTTKNTEEATVDNRDDYTKEEKAEDPSKEDTGIFFFWGNPGEKFAVVNAGGGFMYVGAMHDSFPHALELSKMGYNSFALIYRPDDPYTDLAKAISFIYDHAEELDVYPENYSLWGGSAGARNVPDAAEDVTEWLNSLKF